MYGQMKRELEQMKGMNAWLVLWAVISWKDG
jgi:hypothetical protein